MYMNYLKIYNELIQKRLSEVPDDVYTETHHIVPKSLGGTNKKSNLVKLTAREHFICHALLAEIYPKYSREWYKMNHAFMMMKTVSTNQERYCNSKLYSQKKQDFSEVCKFNQSGEKNSQFGTMWIHSKEFQKNIKIFKDELNKFINDGYEIGRFKKPKVSKMTKSQIDMSKYTFNGLYFNRYRRNTIMKIFSIDVSSNFEINVKRLKDLLYNLYIVEQKSTNEICEIFKTNNETIRNYLDFLNIERRSLSESIKIATTIKNQPTS